MSPSHHWDLFLAHGRADAEHARRLYNLLRGEFRVFLDAAVLEPSDDWDVELPQAQRQSAATVVLLSRRSIEGHFFRAEVQDAISRSRLDPAGHRVVPVFLEHGVLDSERSLYGLSLKQGIDATGPGGLDRAACELLSWARAAALADTGAQPFTVAVVAVGPELGEVRSAIAAALRPMADVGEVLELAAEDPASAGRLDDADLVIPLIGGRTGGTEVLSRAFDHSGRPIVLRWTALDPARMEPAEFADALALGNRAVDEFKDRDEAVHLARNAIARWIRDQRPARPPGQTGVLEDWEREYLETRAATWDKGRVGPLLALAGGRTLARSELYVSLKATTELCWRDEQGAVQIASDRGPGEDRESPPDKPQRLRRLAALDRDQGERSPVSLETLLSHADLPHLVIEGEAGSGKTVLLQHAALVLARVHLGTAIPDHAIDLDALRRSAPLLPVPVLIEARALDAAQAHIEQQGACGGEPAVVGCLLDALQAEIDGALGVAVDRNALRAGLVAGRYLLLVDSLDEVPSEERRGRVVDVLQAAAGLAWPLRLALTTRPSPFTGLQLGPPLRRVRIAPLDDELVGRLIHRWCDAQVYDASYEDQMLGAVREASQRTGRAPFTESPLLLAAAMLVYAGQQRLPDDTATLYDEMVRVLCQTKKTDLSPETKREALERVLAHVQQDGGTELPVDEAAATIVRWRRVDYPNRARGRALLDRLANETGLLRFEDRRDHEGRPLKVVRPWHRSFQEYLAACRLAADPGSVREATDALFADRDGHAHSIAVDPAWEGVLRFLVGVRGSGGAELAQAYVQRLYDHAVGVPASDDAPAAPRHPRCGRLLGLVATGLTEYGEHFQRHPIRRSVPAAIVDAFEDDGAAWPLADRLLALEGLGRLGDPRLERELFVGVDGGSFAMGGDDEAFLPAPVHEVDLSAFRIAWRPVTVAEYRGFLEATDFDDDAWWTAGRPDQESPGPAGWATQVFHPNHPVTGVSWYEAMAYCAWTTAHESQSDSHTVRLPTEAEWEFVSRGSTTAAFPWGSEEPGEGDHARANYGAVMEQGPMQATPVGAFPLGNRGPLVDLAGNVWEWCLDGWREPDDRTWLDDGADPCYQGDEEHHPRVVRGGSWANFPGYLRCTTRDWCHPLHRIDRLGFRVVCVKSHLLD